MMKLPAITRLALILLTLPAFDTLAQQPHPDMGEMQKVQDEYQQLKKQREQERRQITDQIAAEELARAQQEQAANGSVYDPYAIADMRTKERVQALTPEWKKEDRELELRMHKKMMQGSGMEDLFKMQQEMMKNYGTPPPP